MAKKAELLEKAKKLNLNLSEKNTIAEIESAIASAQEITKQPITTEVSSEEKLAKSGKRSAKGIQEAEAKQDKIDRQHSASDESEEEVIKKKNPIPKTRSRLERRGKNYREKAKSIDRTKIYSLKEGLGLVCQASSTKFDASVEVHVNLNVDPRQADQNIRSTVKLPHGTGKSQRIAVFAPANLLDEAKKAGADIAMEDEFLELLKKEQIEFDVLIATPQMMAKLGKFARLLGPKGLMPNPKSGTVTTDIAKAVKEAKGGRVEYRVDKQSIIHAAIGKVSFSNDQIYENAKAILTSIQDNRPASVKGVFVKKISVTTTMGPSATIEL